MNGHLTQVLLGMCLLSTPVLAAEDPNQLVEHGSNRRAVEVCEQRLAANPNDASAKAALARVRAIEGRMDEALTLSAAAAAAAPSDPAVQFAYAEVCAEKAQSVSMLKAAGWAGKLKKAAEATLAVDPKHADALEMLIEFHLRAPGMMGGDKKQAAALWTRLEQVDPASAALQKASESFRSKDTTRAAQWLAKAADVKPASPRALIRYAGYLTPPFRDPARAEKLAMQAIELEPWRTSGWQVLAALYAYQQRDDELEKLLARAESTDPTHLAPRYMAARQLLSMKRDPVRAERYLRTYLAKPAEIGAPSHGGARWRLGQALELQGKKAEAIAELEQAVKLEPKLDDAKKDLKRLRG
jgi:tetratricopeptide (TPR) repeat protein